MSLPQDLTITLSLISLGFVGGFTHCVGMCGPFVLTQVSNRLEKISLTNYSNFQKLKNLALLPYHLGRITTYSFIGATCSIFRKNIEDFSHFKILSAVFLFIASLIFLNLFLEKQLFKIRQKIRLPFKSKTLKKLPLFSGAFWQKISFPKSYISGLFKNPQGYRGYILGLILGFIPCGLLYGAFLLSASITNPFLAAIGMILFGLATFPALFLTASGSYVFFKNFTTEFKLIAKAVILINSVTLFIMAISLINLEN